MISQADILKTLINKNCTDDAVMATALSPDCTPPKLLEKLAEAERFDLALDISIKLGLDVIPLWRTWALRCLRHRDFQGARDKFRHCFQRIRIPSGRANPVHSQLLTKILSELSRMDENQLSLSEEIELIRHRKASQQGETIDTQDKLTEPIILQKPKIYAECLHYLNEYGGLQDKIRFNIRHSLWDHSIKILLENSRQINLEKFFMGEVIQYTASIGRLSDLLMAFLKADPNFTLSSRYFQSIYDYCVRHKRHNLLYYVQTFIGDHIAAANTQINLFYLKKPLHNYQDLSQRINNLAYALKNYQDYLEVLKHKLVTNKEEKKSKILDSNHKSSQLFSTMPQDEVVKQIQLINLQIKVTRNFAANDVSGCIYDIELNESMKTKGKDIEQVGADLPVTLFETSNKRKTFLAALVLIYFDLSCSTYFSRNGLDLARQLIFDHDLDKLKVFKTAMRIIMEDESCDIFENASLLLERIREDYLVTRNKQQKLSVMANSDSNSISSFSTSDGDRSSSSSGGGGNVKVVDCSEKSKASAQSFIESRDSDEYHLLNLKVEDLSVAEKDDVRAICDEVILDSINSCREPDYKMELAKLLSGEARIELYIEHGKLSNAQRLAFNMNRADYVSRIIKEADRLNQDHVKTICQLWLAKHETRNFVR